MEYFVTVPKGTKITEDSKEAEFEFELMDSNKQLRHVKCRVTDAAVLADLAVAKKWNQDYGDLIIVTWSEAEDKKDKTITRVQHVTTTR